MDYEKKYKEANDKVVARFGTNVAKEIFTDLYESEDEKIRKEIISFIQDDINEINLKVSGDYDDRDKEDIAHQNWCKKVIAWLENIPYTIDHEKREGFHLGYKAALEKQETSYTKRDVDDAYLEGMAFAKDELEKQGEQKPTLRERYKKITESEWFKKTHDGMSISNDEEPKWTDDDKVEPKFKVGDWITDGQLTCKVLGITSKSYELHLHNDDYCHFETDIQSVDKHYHLWNIKDAKEGDVLTSIEFHRNCTFIFKGLDNWKFDEPNGDRAVATGYCCLSASADKMEFGIQGPDCVEVNNVKPATKIQRNLLFQKMREAGYEWDAEKKELKKIVDKEQIKKNLQDNSFRRMFEQKSIKWSEEDERMLDYALDMVEWYSSKNETKLVSDWLKSLKDRVQPQNHWKPSEKQMNALDSTLQYSKVSNNFHKHLNSLYNDLKKLTE